MYVQCERCQAEYEFDDALVSERGTTVKCTSCGHQFKIRRSNASGDGDRWTVATEDGRSLVFSSLKDLQRAIVAKTVSRNDQLSRAGSAPKALGSIAELEPFFEERRARSPSIPDNRPLLATSTRPPPANGTNTLPPPGVSASLGAPRPPARASIPPPLPARARTSGSMAAVPPLAPSASVPPKGGNNPLSPMSSKDVPWLADDTPTHALRRDQIPVPPPRAKAAVSAPPANPPPTDSEVKDVWPQRNTLPLPFEFDQAITEPLPAPARPNPKSFPTPPPNSNSMAAPEVRRRTASEALRGPSASYAEIPLSHPGARRVGGWVVGVALVAGVAAVGVYMVSRARSGSVDAPTAAADPRVTQYLSAGEAAIAQGNLDLAKENVDKASALAENNPDVLLAVARLSASRADLAWLRQKLLVPETDEARINKQTLDDLASAARRAADAAQKGAPEDVALVRARIDAFRIAGDTRSARNLVDKILPTGSQPETAYVLAALDLAESDPPWTVVLSRLRAAASGEGTASRARAALVYALARSGDVGEARKELERLSSQSRVHPLVPTLRAFLDRAGPEPKDGGASALLTMSNDPLGTVDVNHLPTQVPTRSAPAANGGAGAVAPAEGAGGGANLPSDPRALIRLAESAKAKRDYDRAFTLYEAALAKSPSDSEALAGQADVARAKGDLAGAQNLYKRALGVNPSYLPALIAMADLQWDQGDKAGAQKAYRDIVDRFPEAAYPARVKQRSDGGSGDVASPSPAAASPPTPTSTSSGNE